ncbi:MAG: hypothetical protein NW241_16035 [Bacteroidia bacterium]|nr:hypothetical protein [Bacteroidia bacterium]
MKITSIQYYDGAKEKVCRLGLSDLYLELLQIILDTKIFVLEEPKKNSAAFIREALDARFASGEKWIKTVSGGIDWVKTMRYNSTVITKLGVEVQVSARSDLLIRDIVHLRNAIQQGKIDAGVIVVPSDRLQSFLTDRTPSLRDAQRYIEEEFKEASTFPIIVVAVEYDGTGEALPKKRTNPGQSNA